MIVRRNTMLKENIERANWLPEYNNITGMSYQNRQRRGFRGMYGDIDYRDKEYFDRDVYI